MSHIRSFEDLGTQDIASAGGKGANLGELVKAGFPVPPGCVLTTSAYDAFVAAHDLRQSLLDLAARVSIGDPRSAEDAAAAIEARFLEAELPEAIRADLRAAQADLTGSVERDGDRAPALAVRSSATAEDLPGASFAGQQATLLNVRGEAALLEAVKRCWASLWTARAMSYRLEQGIAPSEVSLAVVLQRMVPAEVSGILFTANPATGERGEIVINASYGLGEAIVGGQVTPDTYLVDRKTGKLRQTILGSKDGQILPADGQGVERRAVSAQDRRAAALSEDWIRELVQAGEEIETHFGSPQDIEWSLAGDRLWILQARPITKLPPAPLTDVVWAPPRPTGKLIRRQVVEHMPGPLSPLFDDLYLTEGLQRSIPSLLDDFGMADFDVDSIVPPPFFQTVNGYAYSSAEYTLGSPLKLAKTLWQILPAYVHLLRTFPSTAVPRWRDERVPAYRAVIDRWRALDRDAATDAQLWAGMRALTIADAKYWFDVSIILGLSKVTDSLLDRSLRKLDEPLTSGRFLRGFPSKTLEAQASLEAIARQLSASPELKAFVLDTPAAALLAALERRPDAAAVLSAIHAHIRDYGHQIYTLDFAEATQGEDSLPIVMGLKALVQRPADSLARQVELARERDALIESTATSLGPFKRWRFRKLLAWAQRFAPYREPALFYVGAAWPTLRSLARELGRRLVDAGTLSKPDDLYYLRMAEVEAAIQARAAGEPMPDFKRLARERRALREARKRLSPPPKIPDLPFKFGPINMSIFETQTRHEDAGGDMTGFAVSPGKVTAPAIIVRSQADFEKMMPGHILVCPTTTPAWTPLLSQAAGLVTEIGGILAHGSIVAREYGIPAVMGLENITERIHDGQMLTVDGDRGRVSLVEPAG